jgi:hypothetical protein
MRLISLQEAPQPWHQGRVIFAQTHESTKRQFMSTYLVTAVNAQSTVVHQLIAASEEKAVEAVKPVLKQWSEAVEHLGGTTTDDAEFIVVSVQAHTLTTDAIDRFVDAGGPFVLKTRLAGWKDTANPSKPSANTWRRSRSRSRHSRMSRRRRRSSRQTN